MISAGFCGATAHRLGQAACSMTQPQKSQDRQLVEKQVWNHGKTPSLGGETGGLYLILRPMELSAAERYTTMHRGWAYFQARLAFTMAAFNVLVQWHGLLPNASGFVPLSIAEFSL
jgi:hypothetical protein